MRVNDPGLIVAFPDVVALPLQCAFQLPACFLKTLDGKKGPKGSAEVSFGTLKWLTTYGYFTSERVQREVLKTVILPGRFDGCVPVRH